MSIQLGLDIPINKIFEKKFFTDMLEISSILLNYSCICTEVDLKPITIQPVTEQFLVLFVVKLD